MKSDLPFSEFRQTFLKRNLQLRARIIQAIRGFFIEQAFLEIETPCRIPAPAPELHIDAPPSGQWFLHTSPELCMKRLLAAGYGRIFQICRCFRQQERGNRHLPEFTLLEWYCQGFDYQDMMAQCEALICFVARQTVAKDSFVYQGRNIDLTPPWHRLTVLEAFDRYATVSMEAALRTNRFDEVIAFEIEPCLGMDKPLFLYDYPASCGALARLKDGNRFAERFEMYISGLELCNAFSELTDPKEQRQRFEKEAGERIASGKSAYPSPEKFLAALKFMPESSGNALGVDRLVMLLADCSRIDDVVAFTPEEL
ncbi:MAG: EF-P lysine aminoacylase EpmA [Desulfobacterales bacterium]|nr:EF-P lysine aminoacylase EpmA [Desulfobacterales bacterium]MDD4072066.1 EF-P lysine aminoacylase EpmA [Desulfobacterales bacterium]MDD4391337.1 EF-P lysine aminoacylase EpmA [Desulfobacterales bacterium]